MMKRVEEITDFGQKPALPDNNLPAAGLCLNFRNVPLRTVLNYLCDEADFTIQVESNVEIERTIDLWNDKPLNKEDSLLLLKQALSQEGYMAIRKGRMVTIMQGQDVKKHRIPLPKLFYSAAE